MKKIFTFMLLCSSLFMAAQSTPTHVGVTVVSNNGTTAVLRLWANATTIFGDGVSGQLRYGSSPFTFTGFSSGSFDNTTFPGANWFVDISVPVSATNVFVEYAVCDFGTNNNCGFFTGFPGANAISLSILPAPFHKELTAKWNYGTAQLSWTTAQETNNSHFEIERSANGITWNSILTVNSLNGNSTTLQNYNATDVSPMKGLNYYRLKQVDRNGAINYSNVARVKNINKAIFGIVNNPVANELLQLQMNGAISAKATVKIYNQNGAVVLQSILNGGINSTVSINVNELASGVYIVTLNDGNPQRFLKH